MAETFRNYTEIGIVFPNREGEGFSGPATCAAPLIITPGAQLVISPHPRIDKSKGALQLSVLRETKKR